MKIQLEQLAGQNVIRGYQPGRIKINQDFYIASLVVAPDRISDWAPRAFHELDATHVEALRELNPEIVLIGTGQQLRFPDPRITRPLAETGIGFEVMDTGAACRTYNVLMAEGRRVVAALLMIEGEAE